MQGQSISTIDSHFSFGTNTINFGILITLAERSLAAKDNPSFPNLIYYFNALTEAYELFLPLLPQEIIEDFEKNQAKFNKIYYEVLDRKIPASMRTIGLLQFLLKNMRFIVIGYMQNSFKYFYRMSSRQPRGLKNLDHLIENNIFNFRKKPDNGV